VLARRIIPCLDVREGKVVKGVQFRNHEVVGEIEEMALRYRDEGADELVFYEITASAESRTVEREWVSRVARHLDMPFSVAGGIRNLADAREILQRGAEKISVNSPALENPDLISQLSSEFGKQCVVIGVDSLFIDGDYFVYQYTGKESSTLKTSLRTMDWLSEVQKRGAGEVVLNCMACDGVRKGYDLDQLSRARAILHIPLIASGGAGSMEDFKDVFEAADVDGALAASVFHKGVFSIGELKTYLRDQEIEVRI